MEQTQKKYKLKKYMIVDTTINQDICPDYLTQIHLNILKLLLTKTNLVMERAIQIDEQILLYVKQYAEENRILNPDDTKLIYINKAKHILCNVRINNGIDNYTFIHKLNRGEISAYEAVHMKPSEMFAERWELLISKQKEELHKILKTPEATSNLFWCNRCKQNKTTYYEKQIRSSDEPASVFVTCIVCGNKWKC